MFRDCINAEGCINCGRKKRDKYEGIDISGISEDDTTTAYCDRCYNKASNNIISNKITKYIYKKWQLTSLLAERVSLELFHKVAPGENYRGQFEGGVPHGYGSYCSHGYQYVGDFKKGKFDGYGTLYYPEGGKYEGYWKENKKHGEGILYTKNGSKVAYYYGKGGNNYHYGTCHISGIHKYWWYLLIALYGFTSFFFIQASLSTSEQAAVGLLMGLLSVVIVTLFFYSLLHVVAFLVALVSKQL